MPPPGPFKDWKTYNDHYRKTWVLVRRDRLYREIRHSEADRLIFATTPMLRMEHISQSSIPHHLLRVGTPCTTAEHAFGAGYLGHILLQVIPELNDICPELPESLQAHDVGTGPLRHLSDKYMLEILQVTHEGNCARKIMGSDLGEEIARRGKSVEAVIANIMGSSYPGGYLVAGGPDLDTFDNLPRYGDSMGIFEPGWEKDFFGEPLCGRDWPIDLKPEAYVRALRLVGGRIVLAAEGLPQVLRYQALRSMTYAYVDDELNRGVQMPLVLALDEAFLKNELPPEFFEMTDYEAMDHLKRCNHLTRTIVRRLEARDAYYPVLGACHFESVRSPGAFTLPGLDALKVDPFAARRCSIELASLLGKPQEDVCVFFQFGDKGYREFDMPILTLDGELVAPPSSPVSHRWKYRLGAYLYGKPTEEECEVVQKYLSKLQFGS